VPALAQITEIDPNNADQYQAPAQDGYSDPYAPDPYASEPNGLAPAEAPYQPVDPGTDDQAFEAAPADPVAAAPAPAPQASATQSQTIPREDIFTAAEGVFGKGAKGLAGIIENILRDQGEPVAYIQGQEAGGAFVFGVRYGSGTMHHQVEGDRPVNWTGPSLGFDFGADANKVFVLVYNLYDSEDLFQRYPGAEGNAYALGGFTASYHRSGDVVLIPVRLGVGLRLGVNAGYLKFTENNNWLPF
jgi:hypothetical protein